MSNELRYGVVFPTTEIGVDSDDIRRFALESEALGFDHLITYDHVVGADPSVHVLPGANPRLPGPYTNEHPFHEPFVLFGFLAAICRLELVTGILVLPQRQTVLAAKQAAEVDILNGGRVRIGVGLGWNAVEYEALGADFDSRSRRLGEQIELMRALWTGEVVTFSGRDHTVTAAAMVPRPTRGRIPVWIGTGRSASALERVGRCADGWIPMPMRPESFDSAWQTVRDSAEQAGRDLTTFGLQALIRDGDINEISQVVDEVDLWRKRGATHVAFTTMGKGYSSVDEHLELLRRIADSMGLTRQTAAPNSK